MALVSAPVLLLSQKTFEEYPAIQFVNVINFNWPFPSINPWQSFPHMTEASHQPDPSQVWNYKFQVKIKVSRQVDWNFWDKLKVQK